MRVLAVQLVVGGRRRISVPHVTEHARLIRHLLTYTRTVQKMNVHSATVGRLKAYIVDRLDITIIGGILSTHD